MTALKHPIGILGAGSFVAEFLRTSFEASEIVGFSRDVAPLSHCPAQVPHWISLIPIMFLPSRLKSIEIYQPRRFVALSSTSIFTKSASTDLAEAESVKKMVDAERRFIAWAERNGVGWTILRPTLVYGAGRDRNVSDIARFVRRFGFFPLLGSATGLRQPVHASDVAQACRQALERASACGRDYNISGGETLSYRAMVQRIFEDLDRPVRFLSVPDRLYSAAIAGARLLPRFRHLSTAIPRRMNQDMIFDHSEATRDLDFKPRPFSLRWDDSHRRAVADSKGANPGAART